MVPARKCGKQPAPSTKNHYAVTVARVSALFFVDRFALYGNAHNVNFIVGAKFLYGFMFFSHTHVGLDVGWPIRNRRVEQALMPVTV
jgi:hypothetical protein